MYTVKSSIEAPPDEFYGLRSGERPQESQIALKGKFQNPSNSNPEIGANVFIRNRGNCDDFTINGALSLTEIR